MDNGARTSMRVLGLVCALSGLLLAFLELSAEGFRNSVWVIAFAFELAAFGLFAFTRLSEDDDRRRQADHLVRQTYFLFETSGSHHLRMAAANPRVAGNVHNFWKVLIAAALFLSDLERLGAESDLAQARNIVLAAFHKARLVAVKEGLSVEFMVLSAPAVKFITGHLAVSLMPESFPLAMASMMVGCLDFRLTEFMPAGYFFETELKS